MIPGTLTPAEVDMNVAYSDGTPSDRAARRPRRARLAPELLPVSGLHPQAQAVLTRRAPDGGLPMREAPVAESRAAQWEWLPYIGEPTERPRREPVHRLLDRRHKNRGYNDPTDDQRNRSCYWFRPGTLWAWAGGSRCAVSTASI
jgi:hypothetical protein